MTRNLSPHPASLLNSTISKFLSFSLHGYHTLQRIGKIYFIPAIAFSPRNIKILPPHQLDFFWLVILLKLFGDR